MNGQFFETAGVISTVLMIIAILFIIAGILSSTEEAYNFLEYASVIIILAIVLFWIIVGTICALDHIWGWGLVKL